MDGPNKFQLCDCTPNRFFQSGSSLLHTCLSFGAAWNPFARTRSTESPLQSRVTPDIRLDKFQDATRKPHPLEPQYVNPHMARSFSQNRRGDLLSDSGSFFQVGGHFIDRMVQAPPPSSSQPAWRAVAKTCPQRSDAGRICQMVDPLSIIDRKNLP